jgi:hypothetical protein
MFLGVVRSGLFQPVLILYRTIPGATIPLRYTLIAWLIVLVPAIALFAFVGHFDLLTSLFGAVMLIAPIVQDWLKHKRLAEGGARDAAVSEAIRVSAIGLAFLPILASVEGLYIVVTMGYALSILPLLGARVADRVFLPYSSYARQAIAQASDYSVAQLTTSLPLVLLGGISPGNAIIGGVRFAQTLLGPLNVVFSAVTNHLIVGGARDERLANNSEFIAHAHRLSRLVLAIAGSVSLLLLAVFSLSGWSPPGVDQPALIIGLVLVGATSITSGWAGVRVLTLRFFGHNNAILVRRICIVAIAGAAYLIGWIVGGPDVSIAAGFVSLSIAFPVAFGMLRPGENGIGASRVR